MDKELPTLERLSKENEKEKRKRLRGGAFLVFMLLLWLGDRVINGDRGEAHHQQLLTEFSTITLLPNASLVAKVDNFSPWNAHKATVGATYLSKAQFSDIQGFYDHELQSHGWQFAQGRSLMQWGKDLGGRELVYCKGELAASVEYAGQEPQRGWNYALRLSWGLHRCT